MRLHHRSGQALHLSHEIAHDHYETSTLGKNLPGVIAQLDRYADVCAAPGVNELGVSLRLPPALAAVLAIDGRARTRLRAELLVRSLQVVTLSATPLADDDCDAGWADPHYREYLLDLARILVDLLPEDFVRGALNTVGIGKRAGWDDAAEVASAGLLRRLSASLADLAWQNGRAVRIGFRPMPEFVADNPEQTVAALARVDKDRLGVCLDLDHVAQTWPDPASGIDTLIDAGLSIIEVRVAGSGPAANGQAASAWQAALLRLLGPEGPLTENLTVVTSGPDPSAEQISADLAYVVKELVGLGLVPENEPCIAR